MSITEDDIRLEQLRRLRAQAVPPPQIDVTPPSQAMVPPDLSAYQQSDELTRQAAPPPDPYAGMGTGKQMLMRGLAGAAGGAIHAQEEGGYTGYLQKQHENERQREQDLLGRAKELRGEGYQRERDFTQDQQVQQVRELRQQEMQRTQEVQDRPQFKDFGSATGGYIYGGVDPKTATFTPQGEIKPPTKAQMGSLSNASPETVVYKGKPTDVIRVLDPDSPEYGKTFLQTAAGLQDITGQTEHFQPPPSSLGTIIQVPDPNQPGNTIPLRINPNNTSTPIQPPKQSNVGVSKPTTQTAQTTEKLQTNARDSQNKYQTLAQLLALKTSAGDVDAVAKYFDIVMPAVGRRFSDTEIAQIQSVGDIQARARILLQKFGGRQMFDDSARQEILQSAKINADSAQREWDDYQRGRSGGDGSTTPALGEGTAVKVQKWGKDPKTGLPVRLP